MIFLSLRVKQTTGADDMNNITLFIVGVFVGVVFGILIVALVTANGGDK